MGYSPITPVPLEGGSPLSTSGPQTTLGTEETSFVYIRHELRALYRNGKGITLP
jgi:hypothetical protein